MSISPKCCALCSGANLETFIEFPDFPLTDTLSSTTNAPRPKNHDQHLQVCMKCGHVQLGVWLSPEFLYGSNYRYRTAESVLGKNEISFFINALKSNANKSHFQCAVEIGCNDLHLLEQLRPYANHLIGVDPILDDPTMDFPDDIQVIAQTLENASLESVLPAAPDLLLCRHTLEHLADPIGAISQFLDLLSPDGIVVIEIPCLDALLQKNRFDQIFHQHLHYFDRERLKSTIVKLDGCIEWEATSWHNWGAYIVAFSKAETKQIAASTDNPRHDIAEIRDQYSEFHQFMVSIGTHIDRLRHAGPIYGFGAAQMLPVLAWHLGTNFEWLIAVLDDDRNKHGLTYANLPVSVAYPESDHIWQDATVVVTAVDHAPALVGRLRNSRPKQIVLPLMTI